MSSRPLVSVGMPVHDGERYLADALASVVGQDYANLEIIVSDNASSDRTPEIVSRFAADDDRIRYSRSDRNIGAPGNFNRCRDLASGRYFMWAADDDLWEPSYVRRCVEALETHPDAVLACSQVRFIDERGRRTDLDYSLVDNPDLSSPSVVSRVRTLMGRSGWYLVYGLMRRDALLKTRGYTTSYGADVVLVMELALQGPFVRVPAVLHWYRGYRDRTEADRVARLDVEIPELRAHWWPYTLLVEGLVGAVRVSRLPWLMRSRLKGEIVLSGYLRDTTIRARTRVEVPVRARDAARTRRWRDLVTYGFLWLAMRAQILGGRVRRRVRPSTLQA